MESLWRGRLAGYRRSLAVAGGAVAAASLMMVATNAGLAQEGPDDERGFKTAIKPYLEGVPGAGFETEPILSAGDLVPEDGAAPGQRYQMVGIPDGLGITDEDAGPGRGDDDDDGEKSDDARLFMNHELAQPVTSHPRVSTPEFQRGAFVSEYRMAEDGSILGGRRAFDTVFQDDTPVGPAATTQNATPAFSRFCSGYMADDVGFDRPIYLTGEETSGRVQENGNFSAEAFDRARGSQTVAVFQNDAGEREAHALSDFGFFAKENTVVAPNTGKRTVAFATEDGPQTPDSQLWMYVGQKQKSGTVLERNGLVGGKLYVFVSNDSARSSEATFENGTLSGRFVEVPRAERQNEVQQEAAADARGAFGFVRIEDGAFGSKNEFNFVTTGDSVPSTINRLGMNYRLRFNPDQDPARQRPTLSVIYNADQADAAGQDIAFSPDNMDVVGRTQAIQEDGTGSSRPEMEDRNRDGSVWLVDGPSTGDDPADFPERERVAELVGRSEGGRDNVRTTSGVWESSGIIDVSREFNEGGDDEGGLSFLLDVQAHRPTNAPCPGGATFGPQCVPETVEDGQLLFLSQADNGNDD